MYVSWTSQRHFCSKIILLLLILGACMIRVGATSHCTPRWTICMFLTLCVYTDRASSNSLLIYIQRVLNRLVCRWEEKMFWPMEVWWEFVLLVNIFGWCNSSICIYGQDYCMLLVHFVSFPSLGFKSKDMLLFCWPCLPRQGYCV